MFCLNKDTSSKVNCDWGFQCKGINNNYINLYKYCGKFYFLNSRYNTGNKYGGHQLLILRQNDQ